MSFIIVIKSFIVMVLTINIIVEYKYCNKKTTAF